ncbi:hypothetical protein L2750_05050 [Shewanella submarina]|uniref:Membrane anchored protein in chemotaxis locus n=1 Tax=Shewanella submarina TaxID=2016376 RepID=A0ABV7GMX0_9GAMM|nr:hypothetical protein [Shewanella submarina]MCL1036519.1 hypothetical protein [Shewanella submarina]
MVKLSPVILLLVLALAISIGCLTWTGFMLVKQWDVNNKLQAEVTELKASQVMLMVPDNQAQQLSDWLGRNPEQVDELLEMARDRESLSVEIEGDTKAEPSVGADETVTPAQTSVTSETSSQQQPAQGVTVESVNDQGIKIIRLPHGGIRVTTRDDN